MKKESLFLLFLLFTCKILLAQQADLVLPGNNIITLQTKGYCAEAVAIKGNLIVALGKADDKKYILAQKLTWLN